MSRAEKVILLITAILAPVPTAYIVYMALTSTQTRAWFPPVAIAAVLAIASMGYFSARLIMAVSQHNRTLNAVEKAYTVPMWRACLPAGAYVVIALTFTVLLEIIPGAYVYSLIAFPFFELLTAWTYSEFQVLEVHTTSKAQARKEAADKRAEAKREREKQVKTGVQVAASAATAPAVVNSPPVGHWSAPRECPHCVAADAIITDGVNRFTNKAQYSGHVGKCKNRPANMPVRVDLEL